MTSELRLVLESASDGLFVPLDKGVHLMGSGNHNSCQVKYKEVEDSHCCVYVHESYSEFICLLVDRGSKGGTFLNSVRCLVGVPVRLFKGDIIMIGKATLTVVQTDEKCTQSSSALDSKCEELEDVIPTAASMEVPTTPKAKSSIIPAEESRTPPVTLPTVNNDESILPDSPNPDPGLWTLAKQEKVSSEIKLRPKLAKKKNQNRNPSPQETSLISLSYPFYSQENQKVDEEPNNILKTPVRTPSPIDALKTSGKYNSRLKSRLKNEKLIPRESFLSQPEAPELGLESKDTRKKDKSKNVTPIIDEITIVAKSNVQALETKVKADVVKNTENVEEPVERLDVGKRKAKKNLDAEISSKIPKTLIVNDTSQARSKNSLRRAILFTGLNKKEAAKVKKLKTMLRRKKFNFPDDFSRSKDDEEKIVILPNNRIERTFKLLEAMSIANGPSIASLGFLEKCAIEQAQCFNVKDFAPSDLKYQKVFSKYLNSKSGKVVQKLDLKETIERRDSFDSSWILQKHFVLTKGIMPPPKDVTKLLTNLGATKDNIHVVDSSKALKQICADGREIICLTCEADFKNNKRKELLKKIKGHRATMLDVSWLTHNLLEYKFQENLDCYQVKI